MFDIGWTELLVIGIVALVVVGPKDLPVMFKTFGRFMARARSMAREFQRAMEQAADDSGVKDVAKDLNAATSGMDKLKAAADKFEKWDPKRPMQSAAKAAAGVAAATAGSTGAKAEATTSTPAATPETAPAAAPVDAEAPKTSGQGPQT